MAVLLGEKEFFKGIPQIKFEGVERTLFRLIKLPYY